MANRRISDLPAITAIDINDADLFTVVHIAEVDPGLKNKKFTFAEHRNYLNGYYLTLSGGTVSSLTVAGNLKVSGNTSMQGNITVLGTGSFANILIDNFTSTGTISGNIITGQSILGANVNARSGYFESCRIIYGTGDSMDITTLSGGSITGNIIRASGITGQFITGDSVNAVTLSGGTVTSLSGIFTVSLSGTTVTGTTGLFNQLTAATGRFTSLSGNQITGNVLSASTGNFDRVNSTIYTSSGTVFVSGGGDVRPYDLFSFPPVVGVSGYTLTTLGNGQTVWSVPTTTGVVYGNQIAETKIVFDSNYAIASGYNGISQGPVTIDSGITVTIPSGSSWRILD